MAFENKCFICQTTQVSLTRISSNINGEGLVQFLCNFFKLPYSLELLLLNNNDNSEKCFAAKDTALLCENCELKIVEAMTTIETLKSLEFRLLQIRQDLRNLLVIPNQDEPSQKITQETETDVEKNMGCRLRKYFTQCLSECKVMLRPLNEHKNRLRPKRTKLRSKSPDFQKIPGENFGISSAETELKISEASNHEDIPLETTTAIVPDVMIIEDDEDIDFIPVDSPVESESEPEHSLPTIKSNNPKKKRPKKSKKLSKNKNHHACRHCNLNFCSRLELQNHRASVHDDRGILSKCKFCALDFEKDSLRNDPHDGVKPPEYRYHCKLSGCKRLFKSLHLLRNHHYLKCTENPNAYIYKKFICTHCSKEFTRPESLKMHIVSEHTKEFKLYCEICGQGCAQKSTLTNHMRVHSAEKPFQCDICGWKFKRVEQLTSHRRQHTGETLYTCELCGKGLVSKMSLTKHLQNVHGIEGKQWPCERCGKTFRSKHYLHMHVKGTHEGQWKNRNSKQSHHSGSNNEEKLIQSDLEMTAISSHQLIGA